MLTGNVTKAHLGVGRLLRRENGGQLVDSLVRDSYDSESKFPAETYRNVHARHRIEDGRLSRAREPNQSNFHYFSLELPQYSMSGTNIGR